MPAGRPLPRRVSMTAIAVRLVAYLLAAWGTLTVLVADVAPWAAGVLVALAVYTTLPLLAFMRWRGWPFYPGRLFRLLVVRPFWYVQLLLPVVSAA